MAGASFEVAGATMDVPVTDAEAAFLADARARLAGIKNALEEIGPPAFWSGASYYEAFLPIQEDLLALAQDGHDRLERGDEASLEFAKIIGEANNLVLKMQQGHLEYEALLAFFSANPLDRWNLVRKVGARVAEGGADVGAAVRDGLPSYGAWLWEQAKTYGLYVAAALVGWRVLAGGRR